MDAIVCAQQRKLRAVIVAQKGFDSAAAFRAHHMEVCAATPLA